MVRKTVSTVKSSTFSGVEGFDRSVVGRTLRSLEDDLTHGSVVESLPLFSPKFDVLQLVQRHDDFFVFWHLSHRAIARAAASSGPDTFKRLVLKFYVEDIDGHKQTATLPIERWRDTMSYTPHTSITGISAALGLNYDAEFVVLLQAKPIQVARENPAKGRILRSEEKINVFGVRSIETAEWVPPKLAKNWQSRGRLDQNDTLMPCPVTPSLVPRPRTRP